MEEEEEAEEEQEEQKSVTSLEPLDVLLSAPPPGVRRSLSTNMNIRFNQTRTELLLRVCVCV